MNKEKDDMEACEAVKFGRWIVRPTNMSGEPGFLCQDAKQKFIIPCDLLIGIMGMWQELSQEKEEQDARDKKDASAFSR